MIAVEWRTPLGLVVSRALVSDLADARRYVSTWASAFPALTPWLVGLSGDAYQLAHSLRSWGGPPVEAERRAA